jgi:hypothetical protein
MCFDCFAFVVPLPVTQLEKRILTVIAALVVLGLFGLWLL